MTFKGMEWKNYKGVLLPKCPPHEVICLKREDQKLLLKRSNAHLVRWISEWDILTKTEFWYVIKDSFDGMNELKSNMRTQVRKGLKLCTVKKIDLDFLVEEGYDIYKSAFLNYQNKDDSIKNIPTKKKFQEVYLNISDKSEFWGVFENTTGKFIAFAENVIRDGAVIYGSMKFHPQYLKLYPSYALIYRMNEYYLEEKKMKYVSDGPRSLSHETQIQEMLLRKFNFRKAYCTFNVSLSPMLSCGTTLLYPIRIFFYRLKFSSTKKISTVLKMVEISRSYG